VHIYDVREESRGPQIFVSRTHPEFMKGMFKQEVPEIYDGIIEIKAVARDPGSRAKIGVLSYDGSIDPVGACVGMRGSRVQAVVAELQGEKIDIIPWSDDPATFVVNALAPAEVSKVVLDEDQKRIEVVVPDEQLSLAIGRRGQNVRLASILSGWDIDILTEAEESERRQEEFKTRSAIFMEALDIDDVIAHLLVAEGFASIHEIAHSSLTDLAQIEGFDETIGEELQTRALTYNQIEEKNLSDKRVELGVSDELAQMEGISAGMLVVFGENEIRTVDDLGDLASDELIEMVPNAGLTMEQANNIIMAARAHWFEDDQSTASSSSESSVDEE
jgi:N utilization substance protein A